MYEGGRGGVSSRMSETFGGVEGKGPSSCRPQWSGPGWGPTMSVSNEPLGNLTLMEGKDAGE